MKIEDKIYIPHICAECNTARLIPRDDLHDHPEIICSECGAEMKQWVTHKEALFGWNDLIVDEKPGLPRYGQEYERKRKGYRTTTDGVI